MQKDMSLFMCFSDAVDVMQHSTTTSLMVDSKSFMNFCVSVIIVSSRRAIISTNVTSNVRFA